MAKLRFANSRKTLEGAAFSDYIYTERPRHGNRNFDKKSHSMRTGFFLFILIAAISTLFIRIFFLQVVEGVHYRRLSDGNRIKTVAIHAPRGIIFDRNNIPLVYNVPGFRESNFVLQVSESEPQAKNRETKFYSQEEAIPLIAKGKKNLEVDVLRQYPFKDAFVHVLGYVGQISKEELENTRFKNYLPSDVVGKMGIEEEYENQLKGIDGKRLLEVNSLGETIRTIGQDDPIPGKNITLNLDSSLQNAAFDAMKDAKRGAVIVSTLKGEILVLVSKPSFDPNLFTMGQNYKPDLISGKYQNVSDVILDNIEQPFLNRAISGTYPPGSTFKLIVAAAGLENKIIDDNYQVEDTGIMQIGSFSFANWYYTQYGRTEGMVDVVKGIQRSNDIFFYQLAQKVGMEKISEMAKRFGVGNILDIDLPGETKGLVPTDEWKRKVIGEQWYLGDTYHYGIGQGYLLTTPLQVNIWTQAIANKGIVYQPYLLKNQKPKIRNKKLLNESTFRLIRQGMIEACNPTGVAWPLFEFKVKNEKLKIDGKNILEAPITTTSANLKDYRKVSIACKTGTAQHGGETTLPHAWITLFAPAYDPQIIITVLVEESGEGSNFAAPVAKKILEEYFSK